MYLFRISECNIHKLVKSLLTKLIIRCGVLKTYNDLAFEAIFHVVIQPERYARLLLQMPEDHIDRLDHHPLLPSRHIACV